MLFGEGFYRFATGLYRYRDRRYRRWRVSGEDGGEGPCRVVLHAGQDVLVGRHGERRVGVPESFGDDLDRHPIAQQQAGVGMPEIV